MSSETGQKMKFSEKYDLKPKKYLGQNFLKDASVLEDIIEASELKKDDTVLEIGPGFGVLTAELAKRVSKVIAVEKDKRLIEILKKKLSGFNNVQIIEGDILKLTTNDFKIPTPSTLSATRYKVVANLPYYITSPVIRKFLEEKNPPTLMVLMVQKEVAERICAKPPEMSLLSVAVQFYSQPKIVRIVKKDSFWPTPKVDSAIIKLTINSQQKTEVVNANVFFKIVKTGFSQPRKQLKNNFKKMFGERSEKILEGAGIEGNHRAETLSVDEWIKICLTLQNSLK